MKLQQFGPKGRRPRHIYIASVESSVLLIHDNIFVLECIARYAMQKTILDKNEPATHHWTH